MFARHEQVFTEYEMKNRESSRNTCSYVVINGIRATLLEDLKEVIFYKNWSYKIQRYIEHHEQHSSRTDSGFLTILSQEKT